MPTELSLAIQQICNEKNLSTEAVKETIESAVASAYRKDFGNKQQNLKVNFDLETGNFEVFDIKEVVVDELEQEYEKMKEEIARLKEEGKEVELVKPNETDEQQEEEKKFNPKTMISLSQAKEEDKKIKIGEELVRQLEVPAEFGRMAAQTAKQVIIQRIREAERENIFSQFKDKQGDLINGTVQRKEGKVVLVDLGETTAIMPTSEQSPKEFYKSGARMKFYLKSVEQGARGPEIIVSRAHPEMVRKLFKLEVPEIGTSTVQIKSIAREAGSRSKVAVFAKDEAIDPIGSCVGQRGTRVQTIINELGGEKIDIIEWDEDVEKFITKALAPAKILKVELNEENKQAKAFVKEDQYSLAIGKEGQNARLAAKLTGWRIDIISEDGVEGKQQEDTEEPADEATKKQEKQDKKEEKAEDTKEDNNEDKADDKEDNSKDKKDKEGKKEE